MNAERAIVETFALKPFYVCDASHVFRKDRLAGFMGGPCCHFVILRSGEVVKGRPLATPSPAHAATDVVIRVVGGIPSAPLKSTGKPSWDAYSSDQAKALEVLLRDLGLPVEDRRASA